MSPTEAFCTLRILPRIGSSAWNSEFRASFAVPIAESPSTMNSSVRSTSVLRQSASLAGSDDDSSAFLRRCASRCWRAATRVRDAPTTFSSTPRACTFVAPLVEVRNAVSSRSTTLATSRATGRGAEHLLGLALELRLGQPHGDDRRHPLQHVVLDDLLAGLAAAGCPPARSLNALVSARSKPATWVPPLGVAMMLTNDCDRGVVAGPPAHRDVDVEVAVDVGRASCGPASSSIGTVSVNRSCPAAGPPR